MTEQKRPVLTLKRKTEGTAPVRSRKTIINVTTPPKWKVKKQKLAELKELVIRIDPKAFIIVQEAHQVLGDGFSRYSKESL